MTNKKLMDNVNNFIKLHKYSISKNNLKILNIKLYNHLFKNYDKEFKYYQENKNGGGTILPSEYFGIQNSSYVNSNNSTNMEATNNIAKPILNSKIFPLNGGSCSCMIGGTYKEYSFFNNDNLKELKKNNIINFANKEIKYHKTFLNNKLTLKLHKLFNSVKNYKNIIGISHINKL